MMTQTAEAPTTEAAQTMSRTPPYVSFKTLQTLLQDLKTQGLPPQIDRSVLRRFSGGVASQLLMALRSLGLINDDNKPTDRLERFVETLDTEAFKPALREALGATYPYLGKIDLKTATPSMFVDAFKNGVSAKDDVLRKCRTFYLHAAQFGGVEIGPRIANGSVPRTPTSGASRRKPRAKTEVNGDILSNGNDKLGSQSGGLADDPWLAKYPEFDPSWPDEIKKSWFAGYKDLMALRRKEPQ